MPAPRGQALIDRRLYLPKDRAADEARRAGAKIPPEISFATKTAMAGEVIASALDAAAAEGTPCRRVLADALYDWWHLRLSSETETGFARWLLIRRIRKDPPELVFYLVFGPEETSLAELAGAAGLRRTIEKYFQRAKDEAGLDHCEARSWHGWHRYMTLVLAAAAFPSRLTAQLRESAWKKPNKTSPKPAPALKPAAPELRRMIAFFLFPPPLNKEEAHHALKGALRIGRQGEIRDRTTEGQHFRIAGLNLLSAIIIYWNSRQLGSAVAKRQRARLDCPPELLAHISPPG